MCVLKTYVFEIFISRCIYIYIYILFYTLYSFNWIKFLLEIEKKNIYIYIIYSPFQSYSIEFLLIIFICKTFNIHRYSKYHDLSVVLIISKFFFLAYENFHLEKKVNIYKLNKGNMKKKN